MSEQPPSTSNCLESEEPISLVRNFRQAAGLSRIYRCANTDKLGTLFDVENAVEDGSLKFDRSSAEYKMLHDAGLILDLRSDSERNEAQARSWMAKAPGGSISISNFNRDKPKQTNNDGKRSVYRIDVLSPRRLFDYLGDTWVTTPVQKAQYSFCFAFDTQKLHEIRMDILNEKGLEGLYEAIIETSGEELFASLCAITEYLEKNSHGDVIVHCVQGKDRTGLVVMLCQAILGIEDAIIIQDYHKSDAILKLAKKKEHNQSGSAAANVVASSSNERGKLNRQFFSGAPEKAMISTLALIREKYGSIFGFLDKIGYDDVWRERFLAVMPKTVNTSDVQLNSKL